MRFTPPAALPADRAVWLAVLQYSLQPAYAAIQHASEPEQRYQPALLGLRARRGEVPIKPEDPQLLRNVATVLLDCVLRPEECFRLRCEVVRGGALHVLFGKTADA